MLLDSHYFFFFFKLCGQDITVYNALEISGMMLLGIQVFKAWSLFGPHPFPELDGFVLVLQSSNVVRRQFLGQKLNLV